MTDRDIALLDGAALILKFAAMGQYVEAAKAAVTIGFDLLPVDQLYKHLSDLAAERDKAIADAAEEAKLRG